MTIKPITKEDLDQCAAVFVQTYNQPPWNYQWEFDNAVIYLNEYYQSPQFKGFMLFDGPVFVGAVFAHAKTWWTGRQLYIDELFIAPDLQHKGYGKLLIKHAELYAAAEKLNAISLMTSKYMPAMKFYESIDFMQAPPFVILFKEIGEDQ